MQITGRCTPPGVRHQNMETIVSRLLRLSMCVYVYCYLVRQCYGRYRDLICSWFSEEERQGLSVASDMHR